MLVQRESAVKNTESEHQFTSRVFSARCRTCNAERIYLLDEIVIAD